MLKNSSEETTPNYINASFVDVSLYSFLLLSKMLWNIDFINVGFE